MKNAPRTECHRQLLSLLAIVILLCCTNVSTAVGSDAVSGASGVATTNDKDKSPEAVANDRKNNELKQGLRKKYDLDKEILTIRLEHTLYGPKGYINLLMNNSPGNATDKIVINTLKEDNHPRVDAIVKKFIIDEADLFDIHNLDELKETRYETDNLGFTLIEFQRHIEQLPLEDSYVKFFVRATGNISSVSAELIPPLLNSTKRQKK